MEMRMLIGLTAAAAVCVVALAVPVRALQKDEKSAQDREKIERELRDLQNQQSKLNSRIRDLRRQLGRSEDIRVVTPRIALHSLEGLSDDQRRAVARAMDEAHRAMRESLKQPPDHIVIPDIDKITAQALRG